MLLRTLRTLGLLLLLPAGLALAASETPARLNRGAWSDFYGTLGERPVVVSLFPRESGELVGSYLFTDTETSEKIALVGMRGADGTVVLSHDSSGGTVADFQGSLMMSDGDPRLRGHFTYAGTDGRFALDAVLRSMSFGVEADRRYNVVHADDAALEAYVGRLKAAILAGDRAWVADQLAFPASVSVGRKRAKVASRKAFVEAWFDRIFHPQALRSLRSARTVNLPVSNGGIMFNNGMIWIFSTQQRPKGFPPGPPRLYIDWLSS
ncbi:MAG: hypothetical protein H6934_12265 [Burkholderiaceae bacterium]|nr:hypothetical protein [Burkholderiaceae bacterium]